MKCDKIAQRAERVIDAEGEFANDTDYVADVLNEFQEDIAKSMRPITTTDITISSTEATDGTWKDLPTDLISVYTNNDDHAITDSDGDLFTGTYEVRIYGSISQIRFDEAETYTIPYERTPTEIVDTALATTDPDMHPYLHSLGAIYLASKYKSKDDDENPDAQRLMNQYENEKLDRISTLTTGVPKNVANEVW